MVADLSVQNADADHGREVVVQPGATPPAGSPAAPTSGAPQSESTSGGWDFPVAPWVMPGGPRDTVATPELDEARESEDQFVPPDPGDVIGTDRLVNLAWVVVILAPIALIFGLAVWSPAPKYALEALGAALLAALVVLLWRIPSAPEHEDSGPGAVV